jgi:lysine biosynthesis protein LysW
MVSIGKKVTVSCLECEHSFELSYQPVVGQIITCPSCEVELEVIGTQPLELDFYFEEWEEDWDDDEEWDDEWDEDEDED